MERYPGLTRCLVHEPVFCSALKAAGKPLSLAGSMIAAIARANNCVLLTWSVQDFSAISFLLIENWFEEVGLAL
jgi:hypothetical protein